MGVQQATMKDIVHNFKECLPKLRTLALRGITVFGLVRIMETWDCTCPGKHECTELKENKRK